MTYATLFTQASSKHSLSPIIMAVVGLLAYTAVLMFGLPSALSEAFFVPNAPFLYLGSLIFLYLAYHPAGWLGTLTSFSATLIVFAAQLAWLWRSGRSESFYLLGGLLPVSDASAYYSGALQILEGHRVYGMIAWRPLFSGVLATLLGLTQHNLQVALSLFVLMNALACFFLARELQRSHGTAAGVLTLATIFMFYRPFIGTTMTENLGLALGAVGLAVLWRGTVNQQRNLCLLGLLLLTLALNARAGTFLILPALIVWGTWSFRGAARFSRRFLLSSIGIVLLGFMANALVLKAIADPAAVPNANFAYSLYGLIVGGNWTTIFTDHPEINTLSEVQRTHRIYGLIFETLRTDPLAFVRACWRAWTFFLARQFVFAFVRHPLFHDLLNVLSIVALVAVYRWRKTPVGSFILASISGIFLSIPFVPPWDAGMRPYAATLPVLALLPALGLVAIAQIMQRHRRAQGPQLHHQPTVLWRFTVSLICLSIGGPIVTIIAARLWHQHPQFVALSCSGGTEAFYVHKSAGSSIHLVANYAFQETDMLHLRLEDFRSYLHRHRLLYDWDKELPALTRELLRLPPNTTLSSTIDFTTSKPLWIIANTNIVPKENGIIGVCAKKTMNPELKGYHGFQVFYADSIQLLRASSAGHRQWDPVQPAAPRDTSFTDALTPGQELTPFMLTISPPSGAYIMTQVFDFAALLQAPGLTVVGGVIMIDGVDKTADFTPHVVRGMLTLGEGKTFRYRGLSSAMLGPGTHRVDVCLHLSNGTQACDSVIWKILGNIEP